MRLQKRERRKREKVEKKGRHYCVVYINSRASVTGGIMDSQDSSLFFVSFQSLFVFTYKYITYLCPQYGFSLPQPLFSN